MKRKTTIIFLVSLLNLTGCLNIIDNNSSTNNSSNSSSSSLLSSTSSKNDSSLSSSKNNPKETYTVTWKNYNGEVLEIDNEVIYGTFPKYNDDTPLKEGTDQVRYIFNGWSPKLNIVTSDITYTATFVEVNNNDIIPGVYPVISSDKKTVQYGFYPQSYVKDLSFISTLETLEPTSYNNWYLYEGNYYVKEKAKVYNNENYTFNDGVSIVNENEYWFKCEPITWNILSSLGGTYTLLSSLLLDAHNYYNNYDSRVENNEIIYSNNYKESDIREWLNNDFYNKAFGLNNTFIQNSYIDNSARTLDVNSDEYICSNTLDKVFLPSYQDYLNSEFGFEVDSNSSSNTRTCKTSEYTRVRGSWYNTTSSLKYNGSYWTRTPSSEYSYCAWNVNSSGYLSTYAIDGVSHSVRPSITICF